MHLAPYDTVCMQCSIFKALRKSHAISFNTEPFSWKMVGLHILAEWKMVGLYFSVTLNFGKEIESNCWALAHKSNTPQLNGWVDLELMVKVDTASSGETQTV